MKRKNLSIVGSVEWLVASSELGRITPPMFFGIAHSKWVAGERVISAHSEGLKVAVFSVIWEWRGSADSKEVTDTICILIGILIGLRILKELEGSPGGRA